MYNKITIKGLMDSTHDIICEVIKEYEHGFNCEFGWGLYRVNNSQTPAIFLEVRKKGFRKHSIINKKSVVSIKDM